MFGASEAPYDHSLAPKRHDSEHFSLVDWLILGVFLLPEPKADLTEVRSSFPVEAGIRCDANDLSAALFKTRLGRYRHRQEQNAHEDDVKEVLHSFPLEKPHEWNPSFVAVVLVLVLNGNVIPFNRIIKDLHDVNNTMRS